MSMDMANTAKTVRKKAVPAKAARKQTVRKQAAGKRVQRTSAKPATASLTLEVQYATPRTGVPSRQRLQQWAQAAYEVHHAAHAPRRKHAVPPVQVSLRVVGTAESRKLNRDWRDEDHATNVLSFPAGEGFDVDTVPSLGDLAICVPVVKREAQQQGKRLDAHWAHMMIHGTLHLLGYDHENDRDALVMEACEVAILESFGFDNPYQAEQE